MQDLRVLRSWKLGVTFPRCAFPGALSARCWSRMSSTQPPSEGAETSVSAPVPDKREQEQTGPPPWNCS